MALSQTLTFSVHFNFEIDTKTPSRATGLNPVAYELHLESFKGKGKRTWTSLQQNELIGLKWDPDTVTVFKAPQIILLCNQG